MGQGWKPAPDPNDPALEDPLNHTAFYQAGAPFVEENDHDTGLRCWCGREVVYAMNDEPDDRWVHVGVGDEADPTSQAESQGFVETL